MSKGFDSGRQLPEKPSVSHHANSSMTVKMMIPVLMSKPPNRGQWSRRAVRTEPIAPSVQASAPCS